jgi:hypothetical protein
VPRPRVDYAMVWGSTYHKQHLSLSLSLSLDVAHASTCACTCASDRLGATPAWRAAGMRRRGGGGAAGWPNSTKAAAERGRQLTKHSGGGGAQSLNILVFLLGAIANDMYVYIRFEIVFAD